MSRIVLVFLITTFAIACNSSANKTDTGKTDSTNTKSTFSWSREDELEFLAGCVDNAKVKLGDTLAYAQCNCVLEKLQQTFPSLDSAAGTLSDTTKAAAFASQCK